jgi:hypothetical protein
MLDSLLIELLQLATRYRSRCRRCDIEHCRSLCWLFFIELEPHSRSFHCYLLRLKNHHLQAKRTLSISTRRIAEILRLRSGLVTPSEVEVRRSAERLRLKPRTYQLLTPPEVRASTPLGPRSTLGRIEGRWRRSSEVEIFTRRTGIIINSRLRSKWSTAPSTPLRVS